MDNTEDNKTAPKGFNFNEAFVTDKKLETEGAWDEIYMDGGSLAVLVARKGNLNYNRMLRSKMARNKGKLEREDQSASDLFDKIRSEVMAKTILLGWGTLIVSGEIWEYSVVNAERLLNLSKDFKEQIDAISDSFELYKEDQGEEIQGN